MQHRLIPAFFVLGALWTGGASATQAQSGPTRSDEPGARAAANIDIGCPSPPGAPGRQSLLLKVTHWCGLDAPRNQWQIKIQLRIKNTGRHPLPLGLRHIRLAVSHFNPNRWTPPATQPGERPFRSTYQGRRVWLIPANPDGAAEPYPPPRHNFTFATHWGAPPTLAPGHTFRPHFHRGDAVFYVPRARHPHGHRRRLTGVLGIAYIDGPDVIDICPPENWPAKTPAEDF